MLNWILRHPWLIPQVELPFDSLWSTFLILFFFPVVLIFKTKVWPQLRLIYFKLSGQVAVGKQRDLVTAHVVAKTEADWLETLARILVFSIWLIPLGVSALLSLFGLLLLAEEWIYSKWAEASHAQDTEFDRTSQQKEELQKEPPRHAT